MKELDIELKQFYKEHGLNNERRTAEHSGCWGKTCSHSINELNIWQGKVRKYSFSFEEGCSTKMIISTLTQRLTEPPFNFKSK